MHHYNLYVITGLWRKSVLFFLTAKMDKMDKSNNMVQNDAIFLSTKITLSFQAPLIFGIYAYCEFFNLPYDWEHMPRW